MKRTDTLFDKFDAYLNNRLAGDELSNFEQSLQLDGALQDELNKYKMIKLALEDTDSIKFRKKLMEIDAKLALGQDTQDNDEGEVIALQTKKRNKINWRIAAAFVILMGLSASFWLFNPTNDNVFEDHYLPYPISDITRGAEATGNILLKIAPDYKKENYNKTIPFLEQQIALEPKNTLLKLYLGNSYLNTNQEKKAISLFNSIEKTDEYYSDAQWFLGLSYVKINNIQDAKIQFKELSGYPNLYKNKASEILETLD